MNEVKVQAEGMGSEKVDHDFDENGDFEKPQCCIEVEWSTDAVENPPWEPAGDMTNIPYWKFNEFDGRWYCEFSNCAMHQDYKLAAVTRGRRPKISEMARRKRNFEQVWLERSADEDYLWLHNLRRVLGRAKRRAELMADEQIEHGILKSSNREAFQKQRIA